MYNVKIIQDSLAPNGKRLTTWELTYPRFVHAELMTHRLFSRNSSSSRAIPISKLIKQVLSDPAHPVWWGKNQVGMQAKEELVTWRRWVATKLWFWSRYPMVAIAWLLSKVGLHKQIANRLIEPWMYITVLVTSTEFENWFRLRTHPDAQPEIRDIAIKMERLYTSNEPRRLDAGEWHTPLMRKEDIQAVWDLYALKGKDGITVSVNIKKVDEAIRKVSVAHCARVSYLTHTGIRDISADLKLHDTLLEQGHMSPFEHVACAMPAECLAWSGNFQGWAQYRESVDKTFTFVGGWRPWHDAK